MTHFVTDFWIALADFFILQQWNGQMCLLDAHPLKLLPEWLLYTPLTAGSLPCQTGGGDGGGLSLRRQVLTYEGRCERFKRYQPQMVVFNLLHVAPPYLHWLQGLFILNSKLTNTWFCNFFLDGIKSVLMLMFKRTFGGQTDHSLLHCCRMEKPTRAITKKFYTLMSFYDGGLRPSSKEKKQRF